MRNQDSVRAASSRPQQGSRLAALRVAAGLSQGELARRINVPQQNIAFWERSSKPPRSDVLPAMARVLGVSVESLLDVEAPAPAATPRRPLSGKLQRVFDQAAGLPRRQQEKIAEFIEVYLERYALQRSREQE